ncbi:chromo domain-containing protein [Aspergillus aculeatinus CBS 121060]|uniref:Heterochromatin protein n=1 Tax=Aspergillus aculeatinus CBS 121060 TaxID=1448322 RepID=A0ACD1HLK5_9EURO|nr:heterochromatin protein [Aspergillus aculeatinus CBS 121060]RAH74478.1 heterochromatin protein [Aspergillus aculeatinus CBS 121060]
MPPPVTDVSDDESTGESIPYEEAPAPKKQAKKQAVDDNEDDEDEDEEEDVYHVEKIVSHEWGKKGELLLQVKWKGYDDPADMTLEPEGNLDGAQEAVDEYFSKLGGRPEKPQTKKRKSLGRPPKSATPEKTQPNKRRKSRENESPEPQAAEEDSDSGSWVPKSKSWEKEVDNVDTIFREPGSGNLLAILNWKNGRKSKVLIETCYERCPRKMLDFYESHLVFKEG